MGERPGHEAGAAIEHERRKARSRNVSELQGVYGKYTVSKADGSPVDPDAFYFVLRLDTDPAAREAIVHYADVIMDSNPTLAKDLMARVLWYDNLADQKQA
jgi:hypothetical protein